MMYFHQYILDDGDTIYIIWQGEDNTYHQTTLSKDNKEYQISL